MDLPIWPAISKMEKQGRPSSRIELAKREKAEEKEEDELTNKCTEQIIHIDKKEEGSEYALLRVFCYLRHYYFDTWISIWEICFKSIQSKIPEATFFQLFEHYFVVNSINTLVRSSYSAHTSSLELILKKSP